jgi:L-alanine-DL-glutamate epimerase-like enolase superfamily enzyme
MLIRDFDAAGCATRWRRRVAQIKYRLGAAVGSRLLAAQALHLACALPGVAYACELAEFDRLLDDPFAGLEVEDGTLALPGGPGSGVRPVGERATLRGTGT